jgi:hypothetical protein
MRVCRMLTTAALVAAATGLGSDLVRAQLPGQVARPASGNPVGTSAPAPELPPPYVTQQREVEIPFSVKPGTTPETQPVAVRVFVSWDRGQSWHYYEEKRPDEGRFRFRPTQDGEYWFSTQTVDKSGQPDSREPRRPQLRLVIDTTKPQLLAQASVPRAGEVLLTWSVADVSLNPNSLKIEYQDAESDGPWQTVKIDAQSVTSSAGQLAGRTEIRPEVASRSINLRAEVGDAAGNRAYFAQRISLVPPAARTAGALAAPPPDRTATAWPVQNSFVEQGNNQTLLADSGPQRAPSQDNLPAPIGESGVVNNPFTRPDRQIAARPAGLSPANPAATEALPPPVDEAGSTSALVPLPTGTADIDSSPGTPHSGAATSDTVPLESVAPPSQGATPTETSEPRAYSPPSDWMNSEPLTGSPAATNSNLSDSYRPESLPAETLPAPRQDSVPQALPSPPSAPAWSGAGGQSEPQLPAESTESVAAPLGVRPRLTNSRRFSLEYDIESVGPEGVSEVELWGTSDGGRTWIKWGTDPDKQSPFDVEVNGEANYGFRIVIIGRNGLATTAPRAGDAADIWVGIDLTRPQGRLLSAQYGQGSAAGKLDIRWEASDANLVERPITLSISDRPDGAFTPIAAGLPNSGQYYWEFDPRSPRHIFLRLEIRDQAGNVAIDQLTEPIKVEGLEPRGRIRGFSPQGN